MNTIQNSKNFHSENHLIGQQSQYLRQHSTNPIDWYPWSKEALDRAAAENKPIFLSIGYSACHWCHVMEKEVFVKDDVAEIMNKDFICIKVDREERPDLDTVYMEAVQAITGSGGWPLSVFLTPQLQPFYGGTYFPHEHFVALAKSIIKTFRTDYFNVKQLADRIDELLNSRPVIAGETILSLDQIINAGSDAMLQFDKDWGGFGETMKFPMPVRLQFLLHLYRKTGNSQFAKITKLTLDNMASGGIYDQIGGGFHRYSVERTWLIPHFEKMLYDNAQLAGLYLESSAVFDNLHHAEIARETLDFILREMYHSDGGFYSSLDADSEGVEGKFYAWAYDDIIAALGKDSGPLIASILGVTPEGNFEGKNILTRREALTVIATRTDINRDELQKLYDNAVLKLLGYRLSRVPPALDKKIIMGWNGLTISALAKAYLAFADFRYLEAAQKTVEYLWQFHRQPDGSFLRSSYDKKAANPAILDDYAFFANGLLDLFEVTGEILHLQKALELIEYVRTNFADPESGFCLTSKNHDTPYSRRIELWDHVTPSGNAAMLTALFKAGNLIGNEIYLKEVKKALSAYSEIMGKMGLEMPCWFDLALLYHGPYYQAVVAGSPDSPVTKLLLDSYRNLLPSYCQLIQIPESGISGAAETLLPIAIAKSAASGKATAFVCSHGVCKSPTSDSTNIREQIMDGWKI
jgi:uncharacterized protein